MSQNARGVREFRLTSMVPIALLLVGLSFLIIGFSWGEQQCTTPPPGAIDIVCIVSYPNWLVLPAVAFLLIGTGSLIWFGTKSRSDIERKEAEQEQTEQLLEG